LPSDFGIYISDIYPLAILNTLSLLNDDLYQAWERINNFSVSNQFAQEKLVSLFNQPADLVVFKQNEKSLFGFDFALVLAQADQMQISALESVVKEILARRLPEEMTVKLPDGSEVTELVAKPDNWQWQKKNVINDWEINYLSEPALNLEISYAFKDSHLYLSDSYDILTHFILNQDLVIKKITSACGRQDFAGRYWVINNKSSVFGVSTYLPEGLTVLKEEKRGLGGCFSN
jgi:hypothetical protein